MSNQDQELAGQGETVLAARLAGALGPSPRVERLRRLTAGAADQTWRFDAVGTSRLDRVLRRSPSLELQEDAQAGADDTGALTRAGEAQVQEAARRAGGEAAEVLFTLGEAGDLDDGHVMLARRILRDQAHADRLARQCGETLAPVHSVDPAGLPELQTSTAVTQLECYGEICRSCEQPSRCSIWPWPGSGSTCTCARRNG